MGVPTRVSPGRGTSGLKSGRPGKIGTGGNPRLQLKQTLKVSSQLMVVCLQCEQPWRITLQSFEIVSETSTTQLVHDKSKLHPTFNKK